MTAPVTDDRYGIGCPLGCPGLWDEADSINLHLRFVHETTYELATGSELTFDEVDALGLDGSGRDQSHRFPYTLATLTDAEREALYAFRNRSIAP